MKSKLEILTNLIGKEVVFVWSEGSDSFIISDYQTFIGTEFQKKHGHHRIIAVGDDLIETEWLGKKDLPGHGDHSVYYSISFISFIYK